LDSGVVGDDDVESNDGRVMFVRKAAGGKEWGEKVIRRLAFEIGEIVRSLKGFPG
jgi:HMG box factor